jgi:hypothetical protein
MGYFSISRIKYVSSDESIIIPMWKQNNECSFWINLLFFSPFYMLNALFYSFQRDGLEMMLFLPSLVSTTLTLMYLGGWVTFYFEKGFKFSLVFKNLLFFACVHLTKWFQFQELTHLRAVTVLMTAISVVAILTSIAIVRRILMATSVLKASITL